MHFINPFKGLRPTEEKASSVAITSTDHLSKEIVKDHKIKVIKIQLAAILLMVEKVLQQLLLYSKC